MDGGEKRRATLSLLLCRVSPSSQIPFNQHGVEAILSLLLSNVMPKVCSGEMSVCKWRGRKSPLEFEQTSQLVDE